jgi:hypothetical protein
MCIAWRGACLLACWLALETGLRNYLISARVEYMYNNVHKYNSVLQVSRVAVHP